MNWKKTYKFIYLVGAMALVGGCTEDLDLKPIARDTEVSGIIFCI